MSFNRIQHCRVCGKDITQEWNDADCKSDICVECVYKGMKDSLYGIPRGVTELDFYLKALGWQGGTTYQVRDVLRAARMLCLYHKEAEIDGDWESFRAAVYGLRTLILGEK